MPQRWWRRAGGAGCVQRAAAEEHAKNKGSISHYITSALRGPPQVGALPFRRRG
jgi:hypothetical protein